MEDQEDKLEINVSFLNNKLEEFEVPLTLNEFRTQIQQIFQINKNIDEIFITYLTNDQEEEKEDPQDTFHEVKREDDYKTLREHIKQDDCIKDNIIYIETDRVPEEISREYAKTFEQEIECLIKTQLKAAGERIIKGLSGKMELNPCSKKQDKTCKTCKQNITGDIYRIVDDVNQCTYCKKCSFNFNQPMFIIH
jgi:hypothetical protein